MKKIRILLVHSPLTSLFMAARFKQACQRNKDDWQTVGVYTSRDFDESYSADIEKKKPIYKKACLAPLKGVVDQWFNCMPKRYAFFGSIRQPLEMMKERHTRRNEFKFIRDTLSKHNIPLKRVKEIWYGNSSFDSHFLFLCPGAVGYEFEHALPTFFNSEIWDSINETNRESADESGDSISHQKKLFKKTKKWLGIQIHKKLLYFTYDIKKRSVYLSILGDEIKSAKPGNSEVKNIQTQEVISITEAVMKSDPSYLLNKKLKGNTAIVLLMHLRPKPWGEKERNELLNYFESFENYLFEDMDETFRKNKIKNIIIKSRPFHDEYSEEGFSKFIKLASKYNLLFLSSFSETNYPVEFYLPIIKPAMVIGCLSAALYYAKKFLPEVNTYTYDQWYSDYMLRHLKSVHPEIGPIREILFNVYGEAFRNVLPQNIDDNYVLDINELKHANKLSVV